MSRYELSQHPELRPFISAHTQDLSNWPRKAIRSASLLVNKDEWLYFAAKRVQHGSNYGLGKITMSAQILSDSYKLLGEPIHLAAKDCVLLKDLYLGGRYRGVNLWHQWAKARLRNEGSLCSASGHTRVFTSSRQDHATFREFLSHEPQSNTAYATNLGLHRIWTEKANRNSRGRTGDRIILS